MVYTSTVKPTSDVPLNSRKLSLKAHMKKTSGDTTVKENEGHKRKASEDTTLDEIVPSLKKRRSALQDKTNQPNVLSSSKMSHRTPKKGLTESEMLNLLTVNAQKKNHPSTASQSNTPAAISLSAQKTSLPNQKALQVSSEEMIRVSSLKEQDQHTPSRSEPEPSSSYSIRTRSSNKKATPTTSKASRIQKSEFAGSLLVSKSVQKGAVSPQPTVLVRGKTTTYSSEQKTQQTSCASQSSTPHITSAAQETSVLNQKASQVSSKKKVVSLSHKEQNQHISDKREPSPSYSIRTRSSSKNVTSKASSNSKSDAVVSPHIIRSVQKVTVPSPVKVLPKAVLPSSCSSGQKTCQTRSRHSVGEDRQVHVSADDTSKTKDAGHMEQNTSTSTLQTVPKKSLAKQDEPADKSGGDTSTHCLLETSARKRITDEKQKTSTLATAKPHTRARRKLLNQNDMQNKDSPRHKALPEKLQQGEIESLIDSTLTEEDSSDDDFVTPNKRGILKTHAANVGGNTKQHSVILKRADKNEVESAGDESSARKKCVYGASIQKEDTENLLPEQRMALYDFEVDENEPPQRKKKKKKTKRVQKTAQAATKRKLLKQNHPSTLLNVKKHKRDVCRNNEEKAEVELTRESDKTDEQDDNDKPNEHLVDRAEQKETNEVGDVPGTGGDSLNYSSIEIADDSEICKVQTNAPEKVVPSTPHATRLHHQSVSSTSSPGKVDFSPMKEFTTPKRSDNVARSPSSTPSPQFKTPVNATTPPARSGVQNSTTPTRQSSHSWVGYSAQYQQGASPQYPVNWSPAQPLYSPVQGLPLVPPGSRVYVNIIPPAHPTHGQAVPCMYPNVALPYQNIPNFNPTHTPTHAAQTPTHPTETPIQTPSHTAQTPSRPIQTPTHAQTPSSSTQTPPHAAQTPSYHYQTPFYTAQVPPYPIQTTYYPVPVPLYPNITRRPRYQLQPRLSTGQSYSNLGPSPQKLDVNNYFGFETEETTEDLPLVRQPSDPTVGFRNVFASTPFPRPVYQVPPQPTRVNRAEVRALIPPPNEVIVERLQLVQKTTTSDDQKTSRTEECRSTSEKDISRENEVKVTPAVPRPASSFDAKDQNGVASDVTKAQLDEQQADEILSEVMTVGHSHTTHLSEQQRVRNTVDRESEQDTDCHSHTMTVFAEVHQPPRSTTPSPVPLDGTAASGSGATVWLGKDRESAHPGSGASVPLKEDITPAPQEESVSSRPSSSSDDVVLVEGPAPLYISSSSSSSSDISLVSLSKQKRQAQSPSIFDQDEELPLVHSTKPARRSYEHPKRSRNESNLEEKEGSEDEITITSTRKRKKKTKKVIEDEEELKKLKSKFDEVEDFELVIE